MAEARLKDEQSASSADPHPPPDNETESDAEGVLRAIAGQQEPLQPGGDAAPQSAVEMQDFSEQVLGSASQSIDLLNDVELNVKVELGRCRMPVEEVLRLAEGSVVELDKLAGDPVDVLVNDRLVARGEVLVLNDTFCVRVNEIVATEVAP